MRAIPGRSFLTWALAYGSSRVLFRMAMRRGEPLARLLADPEERRDPYPAYERLRAAGPVFKGRFMAATVNHAAANHILRSEAFGVAGGLGGMPGPIRRAVEVVAEPGMMGPLTPPSMLAVDPPVHTHYRRRVSRVFTPRAVAALEPRVQQTADDLLDRVASSSSTGFDLVERYASLLPTAVISDILGIPIDKRDEVLRWGDGAGAMLDPDMPWRTYRKANRDMTEMIGWFDAHIERLRREPGDNLLSRLAQLDGDDRLSDDEMRATGLLVLGAGFETTVSLLGNAVALLDAHPDQLAQAKADPALWDNVVEEVLRFDSPVQLTLREAYEDTEVEGVPLSKGEAVLVLLSGANRDPDVWADPGRFDIARENAGDHLAFSSGVHYCLGASLARLEATIGLRTLYERFPDLRIAGDPHRRPTRVLRGFDRMLVAG
ncbi:MAG: cytochrome P450 [Actinomycetia bacterium]|nr:cytochrome P450 [Actinomycetes bacterium]